MISCLLLAFMAAVQPSRSAVVPGVPPPLLVDTIEPYPKPLRISMQRYSIAAAAPGRRLSDLPGHRHQGHLYVYVLEGEVRSKLDEGPEVLYAAGAAWREEPGQLHRILNPRPGTTAQLLVVTVEPAN